MAGARRIVKVSGAVARDFVAATVDAGILERLDYSSNKYTIKYHTTKIGGQIAAALFIKRMDRAKAERIVAAWAEQKVSQDHGLAHARGRVNTAQHVG